MTDSVVQISCKIHPNGRDAVPFVQQLTFEFNVNTTELQQGEVNLLNLNGGHFQTDAALLQSKLF